MTLLPYREPMSTRQLEDSFDLPDPTFVILTAIHNHPEKSMGKPELDELLVKLGFNFPRAVEFARLDEFIKPNPANPQSMTITRIGEIAIEVGLKEGFSYSAHYQELFQRVRSAQGLAGEQSVSETSPPLPRSGKER